MGVTESDVVGEKPEIIKAMREEDERWSRI